MGNGLDKSIFDDGGMELAAHSEVRVLDEAIKARELETGKPITKADLKDLAKNFLE